MSHTLLQYTDHRPYPMPDRGWNMFQRWHDLLFAHWSVDPSIIQSMLPEGLEVDTYAGQTFIAVVPFRMSAIRLRRFPPVPGTIAFPELNVRVYARSKKTDKPGVYFLSLDATAPIAIAVARRQFFLPYFRANIRCQPDGEGINYQSKRCYARDGEANLNVNYAPTGPVFQSESGSLEHFLTERYCLYAYDHKKKRLFNGEIQHKAWPLQNATASFYTNNMTEVHGINLPEQKPHLLFVRSLDVLVWNIEEIKTQPT